MICHTPIAKTMLQLGNSFLYCNSKLNSVSCSFPSRTAGLFNSLGMSIVPSITGPWKFTFRDSVCALLRFSPHVERICLLLLAGRHSHFGIESFFLFLIFSVVEPWRDWPCIRFRSWPWDLNSIKQDFPRDLFPSLFLVSFCSLTQT